MFLKRNTLPRLDFRNILLSWKEKELLWMRWKENSDLGGGGGVGKKRVTGGGGGGGAVLMPPYGSRAKPWCGRPGGKAPGSYK